jgi:formyl-CoA transferase
MGGLSSIARRARDLTAGLFCAIGILIALLERDVSGEGHWVQKPPQQAQIFMLDFRAARWLMEKEVADQASNTRPAFKTSDGYINIATTGGRIGERFARSIGAPRTPDRSRLRYRAGALGKPRCAQRADRRAHNPEIHRDLGQ